MLPTRTMNGEDTFRRNLLTGCRQHQAIVMTHSIGPLLVRAQGRTVAPCSLLRKLQSHPKASPEPGRGLRKFLVLGRSQLLQRERFPFSVHAGG